MLRTRLRDFIITKDDWIFAVADYCHEGGIRSILRYVPDPHGTRGINKKYRKLDFDDAFIFMKNARPEWVSDVHIVPWDCVKEILAPDRKLPLIMAKNPKVRSIVKTLEKYAPELRARFQSPCHEPQSTGVHHLLLFVRRSRGRKLLRVR